MFVLRVGGVFLFYSNVGKDRKGTGAVFREMTFGVCFIHNLWDCFLAKIS